MVCTRNEIGRKNIKDNQARTPKQITNFPLHHTH